MKIFFCALLDPLRSSNLLHRKRPCRSRMQRCACSRRIKTAIIASIVSPSRRSAAIGRARGEISPRSLDNLRPAVNRRLLMCLTSLSFFRTASKSLLIQTYVCKICLQPPSFQQMNAWHLLSIQLRSCYLQRVDLLSAVHRVLSLAVK